MHPRYGLSRTTKKAVPALTSENEPGTAGTATPLKPVHPHPQNTPPLRIAEENTPAMTITAPGPARLADIVLYRVEDAMTVLGLGRTTLYEQIRSGRLRSVKQGRTRLIPATAIHDYAALLEREAGGSR